MGAGAWWALEVEEDDVFSNDPSTLWKRVLRRQGGAGHRLGFPARPVAQLTSKSGAGHRLGFDRPGPSLN